MATVENLARNIKLNVFGLGSTPPVSKPSTAAQGKAQDKMSGKASDQKSRKLWEPVPTITTTLPSAGKAYANAVNTYMTAHGQPEKRVTYGPGDDGLNSRFPYKVGPEKFRFQNSYYLDTGLEKSVGDFMKRIEQEDPSTGEIRRLDPYKDAYKIVVAAAHTARQNVRNDNKDETVCRHAAEMVNRLLNIVKIPVRMDVIEKPFPHAYNLVWIDGQKYLLDPYFHPDGIVLRPFDEVIHDGFGDLVPTAHYDPPPEQAEAPAS